jgi:hypothetical protein
MSVYNGQKYLREAIDSILGQSFKHFELLIIDDGSTDNSAAILSELARRDTRVRVITLPANGGLAAALNVGLHEARGIYVARQDADDLSLPERLGVQVRFLEERPHVHVVGSWGETIDESGRRLGQRRKQPTDWTAIRWRLLFANSFIHTSVLGRRKSLVAVGGYDESLTTSQDYDLWSRMAQTYELANMPHVLMEYRSHLGQVSIASFDTQVRNSGRVSARNLAMIGFTPGTRTAAALHRVFGNAPDPTRCDLVITTSVLPRILRMFSRTYRLDVSDRDKLRSEVARQILWGARNAPRAVAETPLAGLIATLRLVTVMFRLPVNTYLLKAVGVALLRRLGLCRFESTSRDGREAINIP